MTEAIHKLTTAITQYRICPDLNVDFMSIGKHDYNIDGVGPFTVEVIDSVKDYTELMEEIFDFKKAREICIELHSRFVSALLFTCIRVLISKHQSFDSFKA